MHLYYCDFAFSRQGWKGESGCDELDVKDHSEIFFSGDDLLINYGVPDHTYLSLYFLRSVVSS